MDDNEAIAQYAYQQAGGRERLFRLSEELPVNQRMIPEFDEKAIERRLRTQIVQDWKGNICEISNQYTVAYLRDAPDFVTRTWLKCPVETWEDWESMKLRYDPDDRRRFPGNGQPLSSQLQDRDWIVMLHVNGPFWQMREWLGFENLCLKFYDDPDLITDMVRFWEEFIARLLGNTLRYVVPDIFSVSEDMAYKQFSMISPAMTREFLLPTYRRWGDIIRGASIPIYQMDSDGFVGQLIPLWIEAGINVCEPLEVAAENDIVQFRRLFGRSMAFRGGVDKRAIATGGTVIEDEIMRLQSVIRGGGFLPSCDHGVPPDVSWENYIYYTRLLAQATGWL